MIGIVDYGMGNLRSVSNAIEHLGHKALLVSQPAKISDCSRIIIPGVGSYCKAMENIRELEMAAAIQEHVRKGKALLGIRLGMQILSSTGNEPYPEVGLGLVEGRVEAFNLPQQFRVPHVGWNSLDLHRSHPLFKGVNSNCDFYFVHSFHFVVEDPATTLATTDYGGGFVSVVARDSVVGVQFHPEKSQQNGMSILDNFCTWN